MKVLCIHGIGHQESLPNWWDEWQRVLKDGLSAAGGGADHTFEQLPYDETHFADRLAAMTRAEYFQALGRLLYGRWQLRRERGWFDLSETEKWYPGMVVVWVNDEALRASLRELLEDKIKSFAPDLIVAHSLGSLIAYDTLGQNTSLLRDRTLVTLGSQVGNLFVQGGVFGGYVQPLPVGRWFHLYNPLDPMFVAPLDSAAFRAASNYQEIETRFGREPSWNDWGSWLPNVENHAAVGYLTHPATMAGLYPQLVTPAGARAMRVAAPRPPREPTKRALIIGINRYPSEANCLEGCVNDAYRMSEVLQECRFDPEDIRLVLDDRATADAIRERLHWLLDDVEDGDTRVLAYSGHGARLPLYGVEGKIDRVATCLCPHDFNWTQESAITDRDLVRLYSNLPYKSHFLMVLDCCHSGGLTARGIRRARGLEPPDDIRHRMMKWDQVNETWVQRDPPAINTALPAKLAGANRATLQLGTGVALRPLKKSEYNKVRKAFGHEGPYLPIVFHACGPEQLAEEYDHGVTPFGAFTHALTTQLRLAKRITFQDLLDRTADRLKERGYAQKPQVIGATEVLKKIVPWGLAEK